MNDIWMTAMLISWGRCVGPDLDY